MKAWLSSKTVWHTTILVSGRVYIGEFYCLDLCVWKLGGTAVGGIGGY